MRSIIASYAIHHCACAGDRAVHGCSVVGRIPDPTTRASVVEELATCFRATAEAFAASQRLWEQLSAAEKEELDGLANEAKELRKG